MTALDKLQALIDAYNPASSQRTAESMDAHHELALLAHYLLHPMAEALEGTADLLDGIAEGEGELHAVRHARAVFAKLEEALLDVTKPSVHPCCDAPLSTGHRGTCPNSMMQGGTLK